MESNKLSEILGVTTFTAGIGCIASVLILIAPTQFLNSDGIFIMASICTIIALVSGGLIKWNLLEDKRIKILATIGMIAGILTPFILFFGMMIGLSAAGRN